MEAQGWLRMEKINTDYKGNRFQDVQAVMKASLL